MVVNGDEDNDVEVGVVGDGVGEGDDVGGLVEKITGGGTPAIVLVLAGGQGEGGLGGREREMERMGRKERKKWENK